MATKKQFLLRVNPQLYQVLEKWAADELRSVNAQIEFVLQEAARRAGRWNENTVARKGQEEVTPITPDNCQAIRKDDLP
ncbi:MAG: hypothetical protein KGZ75_11360 [Syntrophomonadaceae bacterium]|nr:hypothetical protein [Syntrophomonadaceae bacterium]